MLAPDDPFIGGRSAKLTLCIDACSGGGCVGLPMSPSVMVICFAHGRPYSASADDMHATAAAVLHGPRVAASRSAPRSPSSAGHPAYFPLSFSALGSCLPARLMAIAALFAGSSVDSLSSWSLLHLLVSLYGSNLLQDLKCEDETALKGTVQACHVRYLSPRTSNRHSNAISSYT